MHSYMKRLGLGITALGLIISFQNCAEQKFSSTGSGSGNPNDGAGGVVLGTSDDDASGVITQTGGPNCRDELKALTTPVKMVFIVDVSGSNAGNKGTDPNKAVRSGSIERFYNSYSAKTNFAWSFATFAGSVNTPANILISNANAQAMQSAIVTFNSMSDGGETPYVSALNAAQQIISGDTARAPNSKYIVVFLSDGMPNPAVDDATLNSKVSAIVGAAASTGAGVNAGQVSFNTVYYGDANQAAHDRLQMMAATGGGNFLDTNANPTGNAFLISDLVIVPGIVCQ